MSFRAGGLGFDPGDWWWGWRGGGRGRGRGRGGRGRRVWFGAGDMKYVILKLLEEKPMHGYEVMKALEEQTLGCYKPSPGTVYPTLQWLEDEGLVKSEEVGGKKVYAITDTGREFLEENKSTVEDIFDRVEDIIDTVLSDPVPDFFRLVGRVMGQAYRTARRIRGDKEKQARFGEILEGALKELEELGV